MKIFIDLKIRNYTYKRSLTKEHREYFSELYRRYLMVNYNNP